MAATATPSKASGAGLASAHPRPPVEPYLRSYSSSREVRIRPVNAAHPNDARPWTSRSSSTPPTRGKMRLSRSTPRDSWAWAFGEETLPPSQAENRQLPPRFPPLLPRDAKIKPDDLLDVAHFLRETAPSQTPVRTTFDPKQDVPSERRLVKRVLNFEPRRRRTSVLDPSKNKSLTHFKPRGVVERVSKDGKKYLQIVPPGHIFEDTMTPGMSATSTAHTSVLNTAQHSPVLPPADTMKPATKSESKNYPGHVSSLDEDEIQLYISAIESSHPANTSDSMPPIQEIDFASSNEQPKISQSSAELPSFSVSGAQENVTGQNQGLQATHSTRSKSLQASEDWASTTKANNLKSDRSAAVTDIRAALYSNPTSSGPAPSKPLPTLPADGIDSRNRMRNMGNKPIEAPSNTTPVMPRTTGDRSSNQGVRRISREGDSVIAQDSTRLQHPIPATKRGLNALADFLSRDALDTAKLRYGSEERPKTADSQGYDSTKAPSISTTASRPGSSHRARSERTRARKLRDLEKAKSSNDAASQDGPKAEAATVSQPIESLNSNPEQTDTAKKSLQLSSVMLVAEQDPIMPSNARSQTPKISQLCLSPSPMPPMPLVIQNESPPRPSTVERAMKSTHIVSAMNLDRDIHAAYRHEYHSSFDSQQDRSTDATPTYSTPSRSATYFAASGDPSEANISPNTRAELRIRTLERRNRLLEAALNAVLHTNGQLNRCPCSAQAHAGQELSLRSRTSTDSSASAGDSGNAYELYKATRAGRAFRASLESNKQQEILVEELKNQN